MKKFILLVLFSFNLFCYAEPISADTSLLTQKQEIELYQELIKTIRCPTCQNQNIAESNAPLAKQLRDLVISQIKAGKNKAEIENFLIARYGDFISYEPKLKAKTLILWLLPFLILFFAAYLIFFKKSKSENITTEFKAQSELTAPNKILVNSLIFFVAFLLFSSLALYLWQTNNRDIFYKYKLEENLKPQITNYKIYGKDYLKNPKLFIALRENIKNPNIHPQLIFCQLLQENINNKDIFELKSLGDCYANLGLFELAEQIFKFIYELNPDNDNYFLDWIQAQSFANFERKFTADEIYRLEKIIKSDNTNFIVRVFLASAYQKNGELEKSKTSFENILKDLPPNHPLIPAIQNTLNKL